METGEDPWALGVEAQALHSVTLCLEFGQHVGKKVMRLGFGLEWFGMRSEKGKKKRKKNNEGFGKMRFRSAIPRHPRIEHIPLTTGRVPSHSSRYIYLALFLLILLPFLNILTTILFSFSFTSPRQNK